VVQIKDDQAGSISLSAPTPDLNFIGEIFSTTVLEASNVVSDDTHTQLVLPPKIPIYKEAHCLLFYDSIA
jgi:hypothetical protein